MSVTVDWGSGSATYSADDILSFTEPVVTEVETRASNVYQYLLDLDALAEESAATALQSINELKEFEASVSDVEFKAPAAPSGTVTAVPAAAALNLPLPTLSRSDLGTDFNYVMVNAPTQQDWTTPETGVYQTPVAPGATTIPALGVAPASYQMPQTVAPVMETTDFVSTELLAPTLDTVTLPDTVLLSIDDLVVSAETDALLTAIENAQYLDVTPPELPEYIDLLPEVFSVVGALASGDPVVKYLDLLDMRTSLIESTDRPAAYAFARKGLYQPPGAAQYDLWLDTMIDSKLTESDTIYKAKAVDDCVTAGFTLCTAAHRMLVDIRIALYDLEFQSAKVAVNAKLDKAKILVEAYKASMLTLRLQIAEYNAHLVFVEAQAKAFEANVASASAIGAINASTAELFAASESMKGISADVFAARVTAEKAKLRQYAGVIEQGKASIAAAEARVAAYSGDVALYAAEVERINTQYDAYSANVQGVTYENAARVASINIGKSQVRAAASKIGAAAAAASVTATKLQAAAAVRETNYIKKAVQAAEEATSFRLTSSSFQGASETYEQNLSVRIGDMRSQAQSGESTSRYVGTVQDAIGRSAQISQQANIQLANVYQSVYEAAGRVGATLASGKLSGFRAGATLDAAESVRASVGYSVRHSSSGGTTYGESDTKREEISA
jgi:hypothetical protein